MITLSVKALIIIPVITVTLWMIAITISFLPIREIKELKAALNESLKDPGKDMGDEAETELGDVISGGN